MDYVWSVYAGKKCTGKVVQACVGAHETHKNSLQNLVWEHLAFGNVYVDQSGK